MKPVLIMAATLALAGCGDKSADSRAAAQQASEITKAEVAASGGMPDANAAMKADAQGCKDKAKALELIAASKGEDTSRFIKLWADGMQDKSCRGFSPGLPVKVDRQEGDLTCILPGDDPANKQCFWVESKAL